MHSKEHHLVVKKREGLERTSLLLQYYMYLDCSVQCIAPDLRYSFITLYFQNISLRGCRLNSVFFYEIYGVVREICKM